MRKSLAFKMLVAALAPCVLVGCLPAARTSGDGTAAAAMDLGGPGADTAGNQDVAAGDDALAAADAASQTDAKSNADAPLLGCKTNAECAAFAAIPCRTATCDKATGFCVQAVKEDGADCTPTGAHPCVASAACAVGLCVAVTVACDDNNACTKDSCDPAKGCINAAVDTLCDDKNACTQNDVCVDKVCKGTASVSCDDKNSCSKDSCDPTTGCVHANLVDSTTCDDGQKCTLADGCKNGVCTGTVNKCDDNKLCTFDLCLEFEKDDGCTHTPGSAFMLACNDGSVCNLNGACDIDGNCTGTPKDCDDGNPCTDDSCKEPTGCAHKPNTAVCTGASPCDVSGQCSAGQCVTKTKDCNDGNNCTNDSCDPKSGCLHAANTAACGDGNPCTSADFCKDGACQAGPATSCDDGDACTSDSCDMTKGCLHAPVAPGTTCSVGQCVAGLCLGATCGDGLCGFTESSGSCASDCPASGGACTVSDTACQATCVASKCATQAAACNADPTCAAVTSCESACTTAACRLGCASGVPAGSLAHANALHACSQAFCVANNWIGKKCSGSGSQLTTCLDACEGSMCAGLSLSCKASSGCLAIRSCLQACANGDVGCITGCMGKGSATDAELGADLDNCSAIACQ